MEMCLITSSLVEPSHAGSIPSYPSKIIVENPVMNGFLKKFCIISDFIYNQIICVLTRALI